MNRTIKVMNILKKNMRQADIEMHEQNEYPNKFDNILNEFVAMLNQEYKRGVEDGKMIAKHRTFDWED